MVIISAISEAVMLVLQMKGIHEVSRWYRLSGMMCIPSSMKTDKGVRAILKFHFSNFSGCSSGVANERDL
jgi:hypothetical protein